MEQWMARAFTDGERGGNPVPIVVGADALGDEEMRAIADEHRLETGFVLRARDAAADVRLRFFVPRHEMEMCGHAAIAALWVLRRSGRLRRNEAVIETISGLVPGKMGEDLNFVEVGQPRGEVVEVSDGGGLWDALYDVLGIRRPDLLDAPVQNATTSRAKTLVPLRRVETLNRLTPAFDRVESLCERLESTGLYPYAERDGVFHARQFPKASGYPEDAATGIAAAALAFGLAERGVVSSRRVLIRQGESMGRPSAIQVRLDEDALHRPERCFVGGLVTGERVREEDR